MKLSLTQRALIQAKKNAISKFDIEAFKRNQLLLYFFADALSGVSTDMIEQMKQVGIYRFDDKKAIDAIKFHSAALVSDLDNSCTEEYACSFGDMADELNEIILQFLKNKKSLQHKNE